jgi:acyl carrier protein
LNAIVRIKQFIETEILYDQEEILLQETTPLLEAGLLDSLGIMKLLAFLEATFSIRVREDELIPENFETIQAILLLLEKKANLT